MNRKIERLKELDREILLLAHTSAILGWDQETFMPEKAVAERSEQLSLLSGMIHERSVSPETEELLGALGSSDDNPGGSKDLSELDRALVRAVFRRYSRSTRIPKRLITELSRETSLSQAAWARARSENDYPSFAPHLEKLVELTREKAERLGYPEHPYDALLDEFEPWMRTSTVKSVFDGLEKDLRSLIGRIRIRPQVDDSFLGKRYASDLQEKFGKLVLSDMGYDFSRGRLDVSAHPFTTTLGFDDVRLTTRYEETSFRTAFFGTVHEGGHGLYELGFGDDLKQSSLAEGTSLGIHESQSRFWENIIARSLPFWKYYFPELRKIFPENLTGVSVETFQKAVNRVEPSLIRIDADEVTYGLHIIMRFRMELDLVTGKQSVKDLPDRWRSESKTLLGIEPSNDAEGVLQDIHWSMGAIGYFPTYALGNLYGAQFYDAMRKDIPGLDDELAKGKLSVPLSWLRSKIHRHGAALTAGELCGNVTGKDLDPSYFTRYLESKFSAIYDI